MSKRDPKLFIIEIIRAIEKIDNYIKNISFEDFLKNEMVQDAVIRNLEIIGEAARNIPEDIRNILPDIPWKRIVGFRNIVIHEYFDVDLSVVWQICKKDLPTQKSQFQKLNNILENNEE